MVTMHVCISEVVGTHNEPLEEKWLEFPLSDAVLIDGYFNNGVFIEPLIKQFEENNFQILEARFENDDFVFDPQIAKDQDLEELQEFSKWLKEEQPDAALLQYAIENYGDLSDVMRCYGDCSYIECSEDHTELGERYIDDFGFESLSRETLEMYFDYEAFGRDMDLNSDVTYYIDKWIFH